MSRSIRVSLPEHDLSVEIALSDESNPESCDAVWDALPITSTLGHVVVSGGGVWIPTRIVHIGATVPTQRTVGSVYFYGPMQILAITYGQISESAFVNEVGRVPESDLAELSRIGELVWDQTIDAPRKTLTPVIVERV